MKTAGTKTDPRVGRTLEVQATHAGHTVTVMQPDIAKHQAFWCRCSCGDEFLLGSHWLDVYLNTGVIPHGALTPR